MSTTFFTNEMYVTILTTRVSALLILFLTIFTVFDANAKPLRETGENSFDNEVCVLRVWRAT